MNAPPPPPSVWPEALNALGWRGASDDAAVAALRASLAAENGMRDLETVDPTQVERAAELFRREGFVVVRDVLDAAQLELLRAGCAREMKRIVDAFGAGGNRGSHRFSFGGAHRSGSCGHCPEWTQLVELATVQPVLAAIFDSDEYRACSMGGDFCLPGAASYQPLHADTGGELCFEGEDVDARDAPVALVTVNFLPQDFTRTNGPLRQIPATSTTRDPIPSLADEPDAWKRSTLLPCRAGWAVVRDLRAWHGGTPNLSQGTRAVPNVEYCAPWLEPGFRASVPRELYETLPPRAQFRCARIVGDVDARLVDELRTPYIFGRRAPPPAPPRARRGFVARVLGCARRDAARTHKTV